MTKEERSEYRKRYRQENKEKIAAQQKRYRQENKEKFAAYQKKYQQANKEKFAAWQKKYQQKNLEKIAAREKNRLATDINFRIAHNLRARMLCAIRNGQRGGSAVRDLGCSIPDFKIYIEGKFISGMTWENYGSWHLDHIRPLAKFDLTDRAQFLQACYYTNYQPLWAEDNLRKGAT